MLDIILAVEEVTSNIPRLYTGIAEWMACVMLIQAYNTKNNRSLIQQLCIYILFFIIVVSWQLFAGELNIYFWIFGMIIAVLIMYLFIAVATKYSSVISILLCAQGFIFAEFAASFQWQVNYFLVNVFSSNSSLNSIVQFLNFTIIYIMVYSIIYILSRRNAINNLLSNITIRDTVVTVVIAVAIFAMSNISFINPDGPLGSKYASEIFYIRTLVDFIGVILLISQYERVLVSTTQNEIKSIEGLLNRQYEQYIMSKQNIDIINQKYHDLRNQIEIIRNELDKEKREEYINELANDIKFYEANVTTGNNVLDIVLTAKNLTCLKESISFTCVANGKLIEFMNAADIASIFGNAIDNAIDSVSKLDTIDKRQIMLSMFSQQNFVMIRIENYFESNLRYENGELATTKNKKDIHGYGIKSIRYVVNKYNGSINIETQNNWFSLYILIPM